MVIYQMLKRCWNSILIESAGLIRYCDIQIPAWSNYPAKVLQSRYRILGMLEEVVGDNEILRLRRQCEELLSVIDDIDLSSGGPS